MRNNQFWFYLLVPAAFILSWYLVNNALSEQRQTSLTLQIRHAEAANLLSRAEFLSFKQLERSPGNIDFNYQWITSYFNRPDAFHDREDGSFKYDRLTKYYQDYLMKGDQVSTDVGYYGLGLVALYLEDYKKSMDFLERVSNKNQKYWNNTVGNIWLYSKVANDSLASVYFKREIQEGGYVEGAIQNLALLHSKQKAWKELGNLINGPGGEWVSSRIVRKYFWETYAIWSYLKELVRVFSNGITIIEVIAALAILLIFLCYLWKMDLFEPEPQIPVLKTLLFGMLLGIVGFLIADINQLTLSFRWNEYYFGHFNWSAFPEGLIAELLKLIPVFYLLRSTREVNESFDYIFYASVSGLGYSFIENLMLFSPYEIYHFAQSAVLNSMMHMCLTSVTAYVLLLNKYRYNRQKRQRLVIFFLVACIAHGLYDYLQFYLFLEGDLAAGFTVFFFLPVLRVWDSFKNNALNHSEFFDVSKQDNHRSLANILIFGITGVILFEYLSTSLVYGPDAGNRSFWLSIISSILIIIFIAGMARFDIKKGIWFAIRWGYEDEEGQKTNVNLNDVIGKTIRLDRFSNNELAMRFLPTRGKVMSREVIDDQYKWFIVKLSTPNTLTGCKQDYVMIRPKEAGEGIHMDGSILVGLYLIRESVSLESGPYYRGDLKFLHWAKARQVDF